MNNNKKHDKKNEGLRKHQKLVPRNDCRVMKESKKTGKSQTREGV